jgi:hypothetical protein
MQMVNFASSVNDLGEAATEAVNSCLGYIYSCGNMQTLVCGVNLAL